MDKPELVEIPCANAACDRTTLFVKDVGIPKKTYCDYCCGEMSVPANNTKLDNRTAPRLYPS